MRSKVPYLSDAIAQIFSSTVDWNAAFCFSYTKQMENEADGQFIGYNSMLKLECMDEFVTLRSWNSEQAKRSVRANEAV